MINKKGILPNLDNVTKILSCPVPKNVTDVRQLLGMGSYYRRFIKNFSNLVKPMVKLTKKDVPFVWSEECQTSFQALKEALVQK